MSVKIFDLEQAVGKKLESWQFSITSERLLLHFEGGILCQIAVREDNYDEDGPWIDQSRDFFWQHYHEEYLVLRGVVTLEWVARQKAELQREREEVIKTQELATLAALKAKYEPNEDRAKAQRLRREWMTLKGLSDEAEIAEACAEPSCFSPQQEQVQLDAIKLRKTIEPSSDLISILREREKNMTDEREQPEDVDGAFDNAVHIETQLRRNWISSWFGERCEDFDAHCPICIQWRMQDEWEAKVGFSLTPPEDRT